MQSDNTGKCPPEEGSADSPEIAVLPPKEALQRDLRDVEVSAGTTLTLSPYEREYTDCFVRIAVRSFDDLQTLGLVPRGLAEDKVRRAIAADDEEAYKIAHTMLANHSAQGGCECGQATTARAPSNNLRQQYASARRSFHPSLSRVLSEHLQARVDWDSPVASIVRRWSLYSEGHVSAEVDLGFSILTILIRDITIGPSATLQVDASTRSLLAGTIRIHATGRLRHGGGYLKIWASAISRFTQLNLVTASTPINKIPWAITTA